jgi:hypothetical protein
MVAACCTALGGGWQCCLPGVEVGLLHRQASKLTLHWMQYTHTLVHKPSPVIVGATHTTSHNNRHAEQSLAVRVGRSETSGSTWSEQGRQATQGDNMSTASSHTFYGITHTHTS